MNYEYTLAEVGMHRTKIHVCFLCCIYCVLVYVVEQDIKFDNISFIALNNSLCTTDYA